MFARIALLLITLALGAGACESVADWPPFEQRLRAYFDDNRSLLEELEREMIADGYHRMNSRILSGKLSNPAAPRLDAAQVEKYRRLIEPADTELIVLRRPGATEFEMLSEPVAASLYLFRYIHGDDADVAPDCNAAMREAPCGICTVELGGDWRLEYEWFPQDLDIEARECHQDR